MKNLVMGVATGYDWYKLEPFVTSFNRYAKNTDLVLFVDNISDFTRAKLTRGGVELLPVPAGFNYTFISLTRWGIYKKFLDERGANYSQVFLTDTRDVIFQGDVFEQYADLKNFLVYTTEQENIKNKKEHATYGWIARFSGIEEAEKLGDKKIICCGTVLATMEETKYFSEKMFELLKTSTAWGYDQAAMNYLIYENKLEIENLIESDCHDGNILTAGLFNVANLLQWKNEKFLRGDGGVPAVVHQYPGHIVDKTYREKDFQPDESFNDTHSMLDQVFYLVNLDRVGEAHKLFTRYLLYADLKGCGNDLVKIWETLLSKDTTLAAELLSLSIQGVLLVKAEWLDFQQIDKLCSITENLMKSGRFIVPQFKNLVKDIAFFVAQRLYEAKQFEQGIEYLNFITTLAVPLDANFYFFQANIYRETGRKSEALAAYSKALNF